MQAEAPCSEQQEETYWNTSALESRLRAELLPLVYKGQHNTTNTIKESVLRLFVIYYTALETVALTDFIL